MYKLSKLITISLTIPLLIIVIFGNHIPYVNVLFTEVSTVLMLGLGCSFVFWPTFYRRAVAIVLLLLAVVSLFLSFSYAVVFFTIFVVVVPKLSIQPFIFIIELIGVIGSVCIKRWFWLSSIIFISLGILLLYSVSFNSYFEGDEWIYFRTEIPRSSWYIQGFTDTFTVENAVTIHMTPLSNMLYVIQYKLFGLRFAPYLISGILLHILMTVTIGVYIFLYSKSKLQAFTAMVLFGFSSIHAQAVTWVIASLNTILAMLFGFWSLLALRSSFISKHQKRYLFISALLLLLALWSKETAIIFFPVILFYYQYQHSEIKKNIYHLSFACVGILFIVTQLMGRNIHSPDLSVESESSPWTYSLFNTVEKLDLELHAYRLVSLTVKMLTQAVVPHSYLHSASVYVTDRQFPFFNAEKPVRGTTYLSFTQVVPPELFSYGIGFSIFLVFLVIASRFKQSPMVQQGVIFLLASIVPIFLITLQFPWWAYNAYIDSRHFYHVLPGLILLIIPALFYCFAYCINNERMRMIVLFSLLLMYTVFHFNDFRFVTTKHQKSSDFESRKRIVERLVTDIQPVPKKLIIYTKSNKSYYGFGYWMLPFQTAFSHVLPILFSKPYNVEGHVYPTSFYNDEYLKESTSGLVTQGYHEDGEYGLGYYLEEVPLIKLLEEKQLPVELVYAFDYNGDTAQINNISEEFRRKISDRLQSRIVYKNWQRISSLEDKFSFQLPPEFVVEKTEDGYIVSENNRRLLAVTVYKPEEFIQFSEFVSKLPENSKRIMQMRSMDLDLDTTRVILKPETDLQTLYTVAGNNDRFYKIQFYSDTQMELILNTFEFVDQPNESISL